MKHFSTCAALAACLLLPVAAHGDSAQRPDDHAPIGVMGDHTHQAGEWMLSWRRMAMTMEGNRDGTDVAWLSRAGGAPASLRPY